MHHQCTFINNCFCFRVRIKGAIYSFISIFSSSKTNVVTNFNPLNSVNKSISLFLIPDSVSLSCSSRLKG